MAHRGVLSCMCSTSVKQLRALSLRHQRSFTAKFLTWAIRRQITRSKKLLKLLLKYFLNVRSHLGQTMEITVAIVFLLRKLTPNSQGFAAALMQHRALSNAASCLSVSLCRAKRLNFAPIHD